MIKLDDLYKATDDGLRIILSYFPNVEKYVGTTHKFRLRADDKTPSSAIKMINGVWRITDFGEESKAKSPIDICMREEGITDFKQALDFLARKFNMVDADNRSLNGPKFESRPARPEDKPSFKFKEGFSKATLSILGPRVTEDHAKSLNWHEVEFISFLTSKNDYVIKYATDTYPILARECKVKDGPSFYKFYEPNSLDKGRRFRYFPAGAKPNEYINGLNELQLIYAKYNSDLEKDCPEGQAFKERKLDEIFICSGERDALCCKAMGFIPVWFNSETCCLSEKEYALLTKYAEHIYNVPDLDATGVREGTAKALKFLDMKTIWLPATLSSKRDWRGKPKKDLRDWAEVGSTYDFRNLMKMAMEARFWDEKVNEKSGKKEYSISSVRLFYFLQLNGFRTLRDDNSALVHYIRITKHVVRLIRARDVRKFVREWAEERCLPEHIRNLIVNSMKFAEASLENLKEVELDFSSFTPTTQFLYFEKKIIEVTPSAIIHHELDDFKEGRYVWDDNVIKHRVTEMDDMFKINRLDLEHFDIEIKDANKSCIFGYVINTSRLFWRKEMEYRFEEDEEAAKAYAASHKFCIDGEGLTSEEIAKQKQCLVNKIFAIGYMLHRFKSPSRPWAPHALDYKIDEDGECNGRSGKSFLFKSLGMFMKTVKLSGRNNKLMDNQFVFEQVDIHTDFILVDDCARKMPMGLFYDLITSDMTVNAKHCSQYSIAFEKSPKFGFTSNYVPSDFDSSTEARMLYMVFSDYYHQISATNDYLETRSIRDDFGHDLFSTGYTEDQWDADINFLMQCLRFYLSLAQENIKIEPPMDNIMVRKHRQDVGANFEEWANVFFAEDSENVNRYLIRHDVFEEYRKYSNITGLSMQKFRKSLEAFCALMPYIEAFNPKDLCNKQGRIIQKVNGVATEMIFIRTKDFAEERASAAVTAFAPDVLPL